MIYLKAPSLYNTGFINQNYNDFLRMKQGMMPQNLTSDCFSPPDWTKYNIPINKEYSCSGPNLTYNSASPAETCPCVRYVKPE